jgi:uncharacterized protein (DUF433 family)
MTIYDRVEGRGLEPGTVADRFDLDLTEVYEALLYYHENPATFAELREEKEQTLEDEDLDKYPDSIVENES